jgi:hypothetical protein
MKRVRTLVSLLFLSLLAPAGLLRAEVKTEQKSLIKFEGFLGKMMGLFGGKAAKEGTTSTVALRGNRKAEMGDVSGEIIDLGEEKIYSVDLRKKTYEVTTFAEMRRRMIEAQEKAAKAVKQQPGESRPQGQEMERDFSMKESGQKRNINCFDCREVIMTITTRQKGKTLEEGGGMVMTSNIWLGPDIPALKEIADFDRRYYQKLDLGNAFGADAEQMATALAMYPGMKDMMAKFQSQQVDMKGTPVLTVTTMESVQSAEQAKAGEKNQQQQDQGGGGLNPMRSLGGLLGKKNAGKKDDPGQGAAKNRAPIFTMNHELLKVANAVSDSDIAIPAGFKEKK